MECFLAQRKDTKKKKKKANRGGTTILLQIYILFSPTPHPPFLPTPVSSLLVGPFLSNHPLLNPGTYKTKKKTKEQPLKPGTKPTLHLKIFIFCRKNILTTTFLEFIRKI